MRVLLAYSIVLMTLPGGPAIGADNGRAVAGHSPGGRSAQAGLIGDYILYPKSCVGFRDRGVPEDTLEAILEAVTPCVSLSEWRLVVVRDSDVRSRLLGSMQAGYEGMGKKQWARTMERWKRAPVILAFCTPGAAREFAGVPGEVVRPMALIELGMGVQGLILTARSYDIETHWIASALMLGDVVKEVLGVPDDYDVVFFGVMGYPGEEIDVSFREMEDICWSERWGNPLGD